MSSQSNMRTLSVHIEWLGEPLCTLRAPTPLIARPGYSPFSPCQHHIPHRPHIGSTYNIVVKGTLLIKKGHQENYINPKSLLWYRKYCKLLLKPFFYVSGLIWINDLANMLTVQDQDRSLKSKFERVRHQEVPHIFCQWVRESVTFLIIMED